MRLFFSYGRTLSVPLKWRQVCRGLLELHQGCQGPFHCSRGKLVFLSRCHRGNGPHLKLRGESPDFSRVAAGTLGFLLSYYGELRDPLLWPQESPVSMPVARALSGFLSSWCPALSPHLELSLDPQGSSLVLTWFSGFLWSFHRRVRPRLVWRHALPLFFQAGKAASGFLSWLT